MDQEEISAEYREFAKGVPGMRKVTLQFMKLNPQSAIPLFKQVYQYDPDPELRQLAYDVLTSQGISPTRDGEPAAPPSTDYSSPIGGSSSPFASSSSQPSALRDAGIGSIRTTDALSRSEEAARRSLASDDDSPAPARTTFAPTYQPPAGGGTFDGGNGRPVQRGSHLSNVFTLTRGNSKYITGQTERPDSGMSGFLFGIGIMVIFQGIFFFAANSNSTRSRGDMPVGVVSLVSIGIIVLMIILMIRALRNAAHFHQNGQLLIGQIRTANGRWVTTGSGKNRSRKYQVTVSYLIRTPSGEILEGTSTQTRGDLARKSLPEPGEPIAAIVMPDTKQLRLL